MALFDTDGLGETALARARREAQAMERLGEHPHIVTVYDTGEQRRARRTSSARYMAGGDVERPARRPPTTAASSRREAIAIAIDVCRALEHAHARGHRPPRPEAGQRLARPRTAAPGSATSASPLDRALGRGGGMMVGTVTYMPPEQALGASTGPRSDLYSLGAMLYEMVCRPAAVRR